MLTTIAVTTPLDVVNPSDGVVSLREAVIQANATKGANTISLPAGTYTLSIAGRDEDAALTGDLDLTGKLTVLGAGSGATIIDAAGLDSAFHVLSSGTVTLAGMTIRGGQPAVLNQGALSVNGCSFVGNGGLFGDFAGIVTIFSLSPTPNPDGGYSLIPVTLAVSNSSFAGNDGPGIFGEGPGSISVSNCAFTGNLGHFGAGIDAEGATLSVDHSTFANNSGGGILSGALTVRDSTFAGNHSDFAGGAIFCGLDAPNKATIINCSFTNNTARFDGGAIAVEGDGGQFTVRDCTFTNNSVDTGHQGLGSGGAISISALGAAISGSTFTGNCATNGGAISCYGIPMTVTACTFTANSAGADGGAIYNAAGILNISLSTFTGNSAASNGGAIYNFGYGTLVVSGSTLSGNSAGGSGGAIFNAAYSDSYFLYTGQVTIRDSVLSDNSATKFGGGIYNEGTLTVRNSDIRHNSAQGGGDIYNLGTDLIVDSLIGDMFP